MITCCPIHTALLLLAALAVGFGLPVQAGDDFTLGDSGNTRESGGESGNASFGASYGRYASLVVRRAHAAILADRNSHVSSRPEVRVWVDDRGHITKATVSGSGDPARDTALQGSILKIGNFSEVPPKGLPMPIISHITLHQS